MRKYLCWENCWVLTLSVVYEWLPCFFTKSKMLFLCQIWSIFPFWWYFNYHFLLRLRCKCWLDIHWIQTVRPELLLMDVFWSEVFLKQQPPYANVATIVTSSYEKMMTIAWNDITKAVLRNLQKQNYAYSYCSATVPENYD